MNRLRDETHIKIRALRHGAARSPASAGCDAMKVGEVPSRRDLAPCPWPATGGAELRDVIDDCIPIDDKTALPGFRIAVGVSGIQFRNGVRHWKEGDDADHRMRSRSRP